MWLSGNWIQIIFSSNLRYSHLYSDNKTSPVFQNSQIQQILKIVNPQAGLASKMPHCDKSGDKFSAWIIVVSTHITYLHIEDPTSCSRADSCQDFQQTRCSRCCSTNTFVANYNGKTSKNGKFLFLAEIFIQMGSYSTHI